MAKMSQEFPTVSLNITSVYSLIQRTFVESAQNLTTEKSESKRKALNVTVTHPFGDTLDRV